MPGYVFTFRRAPFFITLVMFATLMGLGTWQVERLAWKENLIATIKARMNEAPLDVAAVSLNEADYRPAMASGVFLHNKTIFIHAISLSGEGGWHVLTPLQREDGQWLLVDRGFVPFRGQNAEGRDQKFYRPDGHITIKGILRVPEHHWPQPENDPVKKDWYWPNLAALAQAMDVPKFMPFVLEADDELNPGGYPLGGQTRLDIPNNHFGYALTWYGLALALLVVYGVSSIRKVTWRA